MKQSISRRDSKNTIIVASLGTEELWVRRAIITKPGILVDAQKA